MTKLTLNDPPGHSDA